MFKKLKEAILGKPRHPKGATFDAPGLGTLRFDGDTDSWVIEVCKDGDTFSFGLGDIEIPHQSLIQHAIDILNDYPAFKKMITDFLNNERQNLKGYEEEVSYLAIEQIMLPHAKRPEDGMIYFSGPHEFRVWRCDYVARKLTALGFDD